MSTQKKWVQRTPVKKAMAGSSGGALRRLRARITKEGWAVDADWRPKPGFLYTQVRAISARVNQNFDGWPSHELKQAYQTFLGKPCFVNHANEDPSLARGVIVAARYVENGRDKYVDVIQEIDAERFPKLAHEIKTGGLDSVSMGAEAGFTVCSYCKNKAVDEKDFCDHVKHHKGQRLEKYNPKTGKVDEVLVYESCHKLGFFELSYVFDPADETAVASKVIMASAPAETFESLVLRTAGMITANGDCLADGTCDASTQPMDGSGQMDKAVSTGVNGDGGGMGADGGAGGLNPSNLGKTPGTSSGGVGSDGIMDVSRGLYDDLHSMFPDNTIGGYRPGGDGFDEHNNGALDFMHPTDEQAKQVMQKGFEHGAPWAIWQQRMHYPDGRVGPLMEDRGGVTNNHWDHVHTGPLQGRGKKGVVAKMAGVVDSGASKTAQRRFAWGETEAPTAIDTWRVEGSDPEDDTDDFYHYVDSPKDLKAPDLGQAGRIDRAQVEQPMPGEAEAQEQIEPNYLTLKIPMPGTQPVVPPEPGIGGAPMPPQMPPQAPPQGMPMQPFASRITTAALDFFEGYYGTKLADWRDAIEANRDMTPEEAADYTRQAALTTLGNQVAVPATSRNLQKGTADMARSTLAQRGMTASQGQRRRHYAEGPLTDGGDVSRNDQGEQEEAFISETPGQVGVTVPDADAAISNTENTLVARLQQGKAQLLRDAQALATLRASRTAARTAEFDYEPSGGLDEAGGPVATTVDPTVNTGPAGEELTGDDFESANPNDGVVETQPKDASLKIFQAFDSWLGKTTGKTSRAHTAANIQKAAAVFAKEAGVDARLMFPALGIVLRQARKSEAAAKVAAQGKSTKGGAMRKRADEKLEVAAPNARIDVEEPVANTTDAEAQASQFDIGDFGNNAGDNIADPDLSTDQNFAPGEAKQSNRVAPKLADGILAMRCAEAMIDAGLEENSRERKYQLAREFEKMSRGTILDRTALAERFAMVRQADRRKVASGGTRGAARSPLPPGLAQGAAPRSVQASQRTAANDPSNDSTLFV